MSIYMKTPFAKGDVTTEKFKDWISVLDLNFRVDRTIGMEPGGKQNYANAQPSFSHISLTCLVNESTTSFLTQVTSGFRGHLIEFVQMENSDDGPEEYVRIKLSNAHVCQFAYSAQENGTPMMVLSMSYEKMEFRFVPRRKDAEEESKLTALIDLTKPFKK